MVAPTREFLPEIRRICGVLLVLGSTDVDIFNSAFLAEAFMKIDDEPVIVVSLHQTRYIDASGLTVLVKEHKRRLHVGTRLLVVLPPTPGRRIFEITELDRYLHCFQDTTDAIVAGRWPSYETSISGLFA